MPPPGPPCRKTSGLPRGLPHSSKWIVCSGETFRSPDRYGLVAGKRSRSAFVVGFIRQRYHSARTNENALRSQNLCSVTTIGSSACSDNEEWKLGAASGSSRDRGRVVSLTRSGRMRGIGSLILAAGVVGAAVLYWVQTRAADPQLDDARA